MLSQPICAIAEAKCLQKRRSMNTMRRRARNTDTVQTRISQVSAVAGYSV